MENPTLPMTKILLTLVLVFPWSLLFALAALRVRCSVLRRRKAPKKSELIGEAARHSIQAKNHR